MRQGRKSPKETPNRQRGAIAPLFDRLENSDVLDGNLSYSPGILTFDGVCASIACNLEQLLNTRRVAPQGPPDPPQSDYLDATSDYAFPDFFGLSDFSFFDAATDFGRRQMAREILSVITYFEPRLYNPAVRIERRQDNTLTLIADITGDVLLETRKERVTFPILIQT